MKIIIKNKLNFARITDQADISKSFSKIKIQTKVKDGKQIFHFLNKQMINKHLFKDDT